MELQQLNDLLPVTLLKANISCSAMWKANNGKHTNSTGLYIGKILVVQYGFNGLRSRDAVNEDYIVTSSLPGIKKVLGKYGTVEECQAMCIKVAEHFLVMLGNN